MIGTTLKRLLQEQDMNVNELARKTGISAQTLYSIIKRDNLKVGVDVLLKICSALEVPIETFYQSTKERHPAPELPEPAEWDLVRTYRKLDAHGKQLTKLVMDAELNRLEQVQETETEPEAVKTKVIPLYLTPAAAGYASPAFGEDYDDYQVPADSQADFAFRISGDSMEPYIPDGSIQLAKRGAIIHDGDVGLFFVDGNMKCKQYCQDYYGNVHLFSLNRNRADADVQISSSSGIMLMCFGKVLLPGYIPLPQD